MDREDRRDEIEEHIEERIEETDENSSKDLTDFDRETLKSDAREKLQKMSKNEEKSLLNDLNRERFSRRDFLKLLGFGAVATGAAQFGLKPFMDLQHRAPPPRGPTGRATGLSISEGDDLAAAVNSESGDVVVLGGTASDPKQYQLGGVMKIRDRKVLADGCVRVKAPGGMGRRGEVLIDIGSGEIGGVSSGGHWLVDQTADSCGVRSWVDSGNLGNSNGSITFEGVVDLMGSENCGDNSSHAQLLGMSGGATIQNVYWPDGAYIQKDGSPTSNMGFNWHNGGSATYVNCYIRGMPNNVFYWKPANGKLTLQNCYLEDNVSGWVRTGTDVLVEDTVFKYGGHITSQCFTGGTGSDLFRLQDIDDTDNTITIRNCEFIKHKNETGAYIIDNWDDSTYTINIENSRADEPDNINPGSATVNGSFDTGPKDPGAPETGCPTSTGGGDTTLTKLRKLCKT